MKSRKEQGMSLVELMVGIAVLSFFSVGIGIFLQNQTISFLKQQRKTEVQSELRELLSRINKLAVTSSEVAVGGNLNLQIKSFTGLCAEVDSGALNNLLDGTNIFQWACGGGRAQTWRLQFVYSYDNNLGGYQIIARHSNKCMDVAGAGTAWGTNVFQGSCFGEKQLNQVWKLESQGSGYLLKPQHAPTQCLDLLTGNHTINGVNIQQWGCHGGASQRWSIVNSDRPGFSPDLNLSGINPKTYTEIDFAQRDKNQNYRNTYFVSQCVPRPAGLPSLPTPQECMNCASDQMPVVTDGLGNRVFPIGNGLSSNGSFAASLCITEDYNVPSLAMRVTAYARETDGSVVAYQLTGAVPRAPSGNKRNQLLGN